MMASWQAAQRTRETKPGLRAGLDPCPYRSMFLARVPHNSIEAPRAREFYAGLQSHPAVFAGVEVSFVVSESRSNLKRGPPSVV